MPPKFVAEGQRLTQLSNHHDQLCKINVFRQARKFTNTNNLKLDFIYNYFQEAMKRKFA